MLKLQMAEFVDALLTDPGILEYQMANSDATGRAMLKLGDFGCDLIRFPAGGGVRSHTHEGDHILLVLNGEGIVIYGGKRHPLRLGVAYLVPGNIPHAIEATSNLVLMAIANKHQPVDADARMQLHG